MEVMIIYHPAFDLYHSVYRMLQILTHFKRDEYVETERLRIWDFYLLFPDKISSIKLKRSENDIKELIKTHIRKENNPYDLLLDTRKIFEKIKPFQLGALKCLASYGIINKDYLALNKVTIVSKDILATYSSKFEPLSVKESNAISLLTSHFYYMSLYGVDGLKDRTQLLESKYDA
ncbi:ABC-three component system middle component 5 [Sphingobacterium sp. UBA7625]|nr:ABC-three component system middle component 5 [Sphingobacterium sp. UBA7625]